MPGMMVGPGRNRDKLGSAGSINSLILVSRIRKRALSEDIHISDADRLINTDLFPQLAENITIQSPLLGGRVITDIMCLTLGDTLTQQPQSHCFPAGATRFTPFA